MLKQFSVTIDDTTIDAFAGDTVLDVCKKANIDIPLMCYFKGLSNVGACRLCLVEVEGSRKLLPACATPVSPNQKIRTNTEKLQRYRRMTVELFFAERNHICSVCVANNNCELQDMGYKVGMTHVRFPYLFQDCKVDGSHKFFVMDHNRCIMCTRCVRVCDEVEEAHNWDVMNRGTNTRIIADFDQPWGESSTCTSCAKCLAVCPTGALWPKDATLGRFKKNPEKVIHLMEQKEASDEH